MDLAKYSVAELKNLQVRISEEIENRKVSEKQKVLDEMKALAAANGYSLEELLGKAGKAKKGGVRGPVAVKYRHPDNAGLTWTGRGRKPAWVTDWLAGGKKIEALAV